MTQVVEILGAELVGVDEVLGSEMPVAEEVAIPVAQIVLAEVVEPPALYSYQIGYHENGQVARTESKDHRTGIISRVRYDTAGNPVSSVVIDLPANTHTITLHQRNGDVSTVHQYAGPDGWIS